MGSVKSLQSGRKLEKTVLTRRILVFEHGGELFAIEGDCKHMRAPLSGGTISNGILTCPWHGWQYELATGNCLSLSGCSLKKYEIETEGDDLYVIVAS